MQQLDKLLPRSGPLQILLFAAWFGLAAGLLEGVTLLGLQELGLSTWLMNLHGVGPPILWISPVFDLLLFLGLGVVWAGLARALPRLPVTAWAAGLFALLTAYGLLASIDRLRERGALVLALGLGVQGAIWFRKREEAACLFFRRTLVWLAGLVVLAWLGTTYGQLWVEQAQVHRIPAPPAGSPNILLVIWDAARADHTSLHAYPRATTPALDRLAAQGVAFTNAFSASSWTMPSHATLFTGQFPHELDVDPKPLREQFTTLAEFLRDRGYATADFVGNTAWLTRRSGMAQGFVHHEDFFGNVSDMVGRTLFGRKLSKYVLPRLAFFRLLGRKHAEDINIDMLRWLERRPPGRPFFIFLNYYDLHEPSFPPAPFDGRFAAAETINRRVPMNTHRTLPAHIPAEQLQVEVDAYDGTLSYVDAKFGELWAELERRGLADNTVLLVTSDHGHSFGEGGVFGHRTSLRREQIHVPFVLRWPARLPAGVRVATPISHRRVPATLANLAGLDAAALPGTSLVALWNAAPPEDDPGEPVLSELAKPQSKDLPEAWPVSRGDLESLVTSRWHYISCADGSVELYDWRNDAQEIRNLAATPAGRLAAEEFAAHLQRLLSPPQRAGQGVSVERQKR